MVASFGIAATAFLLGIPALALETSADSILSRQLGGLGINDIPLPCSLTRCQTLIVFLSNHSACDTPSCICDPTYANGLRSCLQCVVSIGALSQSTANTTLSQVTSICGSSSSSASASLSGSSAPATSTSAATGATSAPAAGSTPSATSTTSAPVTTTTGTTSSAKAGATLKFTITFGGIAMVALCATLL